ncbi:MAG TPA: PorP/SprF family type IX secretion system membrane protein [Chitinophagaceae bacterium]|nr:PorP/SprF family type IX secretion system membrane protein [Chitinophagaceae bacterium]HMZ47053.1 PorP/SprF family type IX secretion system membrane protein [Chitinophagaceae bacterium]HNL82115.1 PorP/SprF family type IX secretion system membrane protein [Chitinophagaceae bacterium]HNM34590.1 PorP/SprF family type IX secretion system membrane protein [Chitinophagaceae bacterium]
MKKLIIVLLIFILGFSANAQDPHFSQFFSSPLTLNPAFTGKFNGNYRIAGNYRNQWPTINNAFITSTASVDFQLMQKKLVYTDNWGVGIMGYTDNSANGAVKFNYASLSTAYHKGLDEDGYNQIGVGFQITYANMLINTTSLKFEDQLTTSGFTGVTSEIFNNPSSLKSNFIDLNAGVLYTGSSSDKNSYYAGVSIYHVTRPKQTFTGANYLLNMRTTIHGGGNFDMNDNTTLHVSALQSFQGGAAETVVGGAIQFNVSGNEAPKPTSFYAGAWLRFKDALIPYIGLEFDDFRLGATYDINTSSLKNASQKRGGLEISLIYIRRPNTDRNIRCPKF